MKKLFLLIFSLLFLGLLWFLASPLIFDQTVQNDAMPTDLQIKMLANGEFMDEDRFHKGSGTAKVYELASGEQILRFEDFSVTNGPDLRVMLLEKDGGHFEIAKLKGNIGDQNYSLPADLNLDDYEGVIIYCKPFRVIFSTALF